MRTERSPVMSSVRAAGDVTEKLVTRLGRKGRMTGFAEAHRGTLRREQKQLEIDRGDQIRAMPRET